jgi:hypothetical protein
MHRLKAIQRNAAKAISSQSLLAEEVPA